MEMRNLVCLAHVLIPPNSVLEMYFTSYVIIPIPQEYVIINVDSK